MQEAGRFLRIPDPSAEERARYRRAFDAARQCAPDGYHLKYSGRAKGDFFLGLLRVSGEDDTEWNRIRLARSRVITDVEDVLAAVTKDHSAFEISDEVLPRVLALLRLLAEQALARYGEIAVSKKRRQPRPLLTVHGRTYEVGFRERQKQVRYVPKQPGRRTYDWQRVTPAHKFEPSGELELLVSENSGYSYNYGWKKEWADTAKKPLEEQIASIFRALKARAEEQERARLEREAEQRRLREEREHQEAERRRLAAEREERERREWEAAVSAASVKAVHAVRAEHFGTALEQWRAAGEIRAFCAALDDVAAASEDALEVERLREWSAWGTQRPISSTPRRMAGVWPPVTSTWSRRRSSCDRSSTAGGRTGRRRSLRLSQRFPSRSRTRGAASSTHIRIKGGDMDAKVALNGGGDDAVTSVA
ncbi:hypothetical protein OIM90_14100 [Streptomyces sp. AD16]|nr:hypothetical protein OIM90_14100 [Streptomyces sp. AD16]